MGLDSIDDLEAAIDSMEGISPDGTEMMAEGDNLAREARVRSAYLEWCKEYNKATDESRFPQFMSNFLDMEEYAKESGKDMILNEYADFTEEEYTAFTAGSETTTTTTTAVEEAASVVAAPKIDEAELAAAAAAKAAAEAKAAAIKAEKEAAAKAEAEKIAAARAEREAKAAAIKAEEQKKRKAAEEEKRKKAAEDGTFCP